MSKKASINQLLSHPALWQAKDSSVQRHVHSTGYPSLDQQLFDGGWPQGAVSELLLANTGVGELRLLSPILAELTQQSGYVVLVNPPFIPYAPALQRTGIALNKLLVVRSNDVSSLVWAAYQSLTSRSCSAVLTWLPGHAPYKSELRKLALGAREGQCWSFVMRHQRAQQHPSAAKLRMALSATDNGQTHIQVLKQPGGWQGREVTLQLLSEQRHWTRLPVNHWPTYQPLKKHEDLLSPELTHAIPRSVDKWLKQVTPIPHTQQPSIH